MLEANIYSRVVLVGMKFEATVGRAAHWTEELPGNLHYTCFPSFPELCVLRTGCSNRPPGLWLLTGSHRWGATEETGESEQSEAGVLVSGPLSWGMPQL